MQLRIIALSCITACAVSVLTNAWQGLCPNLAQQLTKGKSSMIQAADTTSVARHLQGQTAGLVGKRIQTFWPQTRLVWPEASDALAVQPSSLPL